MSRSNVWMRRHAMLQKEEALRDQEAMHRLNQEQKPGQFPTDMDTEKTLQYAHRHLQFLYTRLSNRHRSTMTQGRIASGTNLKHHHHFSSAIGLKLLAISTDPQDLYFIFKAHEKDPAKSKHDYRTHIRFEGPEVYTNTSPYPYLHGIETIEAGSQHPLAALIHHRILAVWHLSDDTTPDNICELLWDSGHILTLTHRPGSYELHIHDDLPQVRNAQHAQAIAVSWTAQ